MLWDWAGLEILEFLNIYKYWIICFTYTWCSQPGQLSRTVVLPFYLGTTQGGYEAPKKNLQKYPGKHYSCISAGHAIKLMNNFPQFFICLNSSLFPVDGLRSEKDAMSDNKLFASPFTDFQSLMLTQIVILQPEFKIYISLDWANLSPFVVLPTASAKLKQTEQIAYGQLANFNSTSKLAVGLCRSDSQRLSTELQHLVEHCSQGHHNCNRDNPVLCAALSANLAGSCCTLALIAGKLSTTASGLYVFTCCLTNKGMRSGHPSFAPSVSASPVD